MWYGVAAVSSALRFPHTQWVCGIPHTHFQFSVWYLVPHTLSLEFRGVCRTLKIRVCGTIISRITKWKGRRGGAAAAAKTGEHPCHDVDRAGQFECAAGSFRQRELCRCVFAAATSAVWAQCRVWCGRRSPQRCGEMCARRPPRQVQALVAMTTLIHYFWT